MYIIKAHYIALLLLLSYISFARRVNIFCDIGQNSELEDIKILMGKSADIKSKIKDVDNNYHGLPFFTLVVDKQCNKNCLNLETISKSLS